jgi:hypothetical protein
LLLKLFTYLFLVLDEFRLSLSLQNFGLLLLHLLYSLIQLNFLLVKLSLIFDSLSKQILKTLQVVNTVNHGLKKYDFLMVGECCAVIVDLYFTETLSNRFYSRGKLAECFIVVQFFVTYFFD